MDSESSITYMDLQTEAKKIASFIINHNRAKKSPVAVCIDRNIESIVAFFGILYS